MKTVIKFTGILSLSALFFNLLACTPEAHSLEYYNEKRDSIKNEISLLNELLIEFEAKISAIEDTVDNFAVVTVDTLKIMNFEHFFEIHGNILAEDIATIFSEASGIITHIHVKEGDRVEKGTLMLTLDAGGLQKNIDEIANSLALATQVYQKQANLWEQKIGSEIQYLEAKNQKENLEKRLASTKRQLAMYQVKAPFSGIVDVITPRVGEMAMPGNPIARVLNLKRVYIEADVSERYLSSVKKGTLAQINFPSIGETFLSEVDRVGQYINPANRSFKVRIKVDNPTGMLRPNLLAEVKLRDYALDNAILIPSNVVQQDQNGQNFYYTVKVNDNHFEVVRKNIQIGKSYNNFTVIEGGIDTVYAPVFIDKGARSVQQGDLVNVE